MQAAHPTATAFMVRYLLLPKTTAPHLPHLLSLLVNDPAKATSACSMGMCLWKAVTFQDLFHVQLPGAVLPQNALQSLQAFQLQLDGQA